MCDGTPHKPAPDGGGEVFDTSIEVPVTIRNPDRPLGTHIFTAMAKNDTGLRWSVVTIENGDDAKDALDRITIPQDVWDRIAPTALPRSSIIISDEPLSSETNYRTEFVAVLSNQPQGGFITRKPTAPMDIASDDSWDNGRQRLRLLLPARSEPATRQPAPPARRLPVLSAGAADAAELLVGRGTQAEASRNYGCAVITSAWILPSTGPAPWRVRIASATASVAA
jgi:hypothetical protein